MKYLVVLSLAILSSCTAQKDQKYGFDVDAMVHRSSIDTNKGIMIQVFPIDAPGSVQ